MSEHTTENDAPHAIRYTNDSGVDVILTVPWGLHSGLIPPRCERVGRTGSGCTEPITETSARCDLTRAEESDR